MKSFFIGLLVLRSRIPKNIGINESICQIVGILCSKSKAKRRVNKGETLDKALALTTLIRCMPSIHKSFEKPNNRTPFIINNISELLISA